MSSLGIHQQRDRSCEECGKAWPCPVALLELERDKLRAELSLVLDERDYYRNQVDGLRV